MRIFLISMVRVFLACLLVACVYGCDPRRSHSSAFSGISVEEVEIHREALPQPPPDKKTSWLVHRGGWGDSPAYGTRFATDHYDRFMYDYSSGLESEYKALSALGDAAFIQDFGDVRRLAAAAGQSGMGYAVVNTLSPLALSQLGIKTKRDCIDYLIKQLSTREEFPGYYSIDGKPVVFMFNISAYDKAGWADVLQKVREAYPKDDLQFIAQRSVYDVLNRPDPQAYMKDVLEVFDGIMFWGGPQDVKLRNLDLARNAIEMIGKKKLVFWVLTNGYWRTEKGMFMDPRATGVWRDQLKVCFENEFDGLIIESWNDLEENTEVLPSRENGGVFFEILKYYAAISNGRNYAAEEPGLLLIHPREILLGNRLDFEVVSLPVDFARLGFQLQIKTSQGQVVYSSETQALQSDEAKVFHFSLPTQTLAGFNKLSYSILVDGREYETGSGMTVRKTKLKSPWLRGTVLANRIQPDRIAFDVKTENGRRKADISIQHDVPLLRVDVLCNDQPVWSLDAERLNRQRNWERKPVSLEFDFQMPKGYAKENNNRSAVLTVTNGALVRAFDKLGNSLVSSPDRLEWSAPPPLGRNFNVKLLADADENTCFTMNLTTLKQTVSFTLAELRDAGLMEKKYSDHGRVWIREVDHPVVWKVDPAGLGTHVQECVALPDAEHRFENEYALWILDRNGKTFRSPSVTVYSENHAGSQDQWFWNQMDGLRFSASVPGNEQQEMIWSFDGSPRRVVEDEQGSEALIRLGGGMFRCGHFSPEAVPSIVKRGKEQALEFDGNDYAQIDSGAFPQGAFEMQLALCPETLSSFRQTLYFCRSNLTLFFTPDGRIGATFQGLEGMTQPIELIHPIQLPLNEWADVSLKYDYRHFVLAVNGQKVSIPLAKGPQRRPSAESYLGAKVGGTQTTHASQFFAGKLDNLKIRCGALVEE